MSLFRKYHVAFNIAHIAYIGSADQLPNNAAVGSVCISRQDDKMYLYTGNNWEVMGDLIDNYSFFPIKVVKTPEEIDYEQNVKPFLNYIRTGGSGIIDKNLMIRDILRATKPSQTSRFRILS